jgi:uncharacterized protein YjbI with pentapeptide repeats
MNLICAYLRMRYDSLDAPDEDAAIERLDRYEDRLQEAQVRLTAQRILLRHRTSPDAFPPRTSPGERVTSPIDVRPDLFWSVAVIDLSQANLANADFQGINLRQGGLRGAKLSSARLCDADLTNSDLRDADLSGADLRNASLAAVDLRNVNLSGAKLSGASFDFASLEEVDLSGTDLSGAELGLANFDGAQLRAADLIGANLAGAKFADGRLNDMEVDQDLLDCITAYYRLLGDQLYLDIKPAEWLAKDASDDKKGERRRTGNASAP